MKLKDTGLTAQDIKDKVKKYMIETYERFDFIAETAEGMYLYDENGTPYLDFYAGIAVNNAGSRNPKVVAAVKDQVDDIMHTFNYPYTIPQALLAEKVCKTIGMDKIFYQNSGTEANEAMIKMYAATGMGKQSPIIIAVTNKELRDRLSKMNAQVMGSNSDPFYGAPVVLIVLANKNYGTYVYDGSLVMGNLMLAAHELADGLMGQIGVDGAGTDSLGCKQKG